LSPDAGVSAPPRPPLLRLRDVGRRYDGAVALSGISLDVAHGEFLALIGPSGCGKSTLLRIAAGLAAPSEGEVLWDGRPLAGLNTGAAMVFQNFALLPWLRTIDNVALPLEARGVPLEARQRRAAHYLELVGLAGYARAFPRELSGGMKQRVGLARALCQEPAMLLMDEPFSALDVLTARSLRDQVLELWQSAEVPTRTIVLVTHSIEEAVLMADRVVALHAHPGRLAGEIVVRAPRPRRADSPEVLALVDRLYALIV